MLLCENSYPRALHFGLVPHKHGATLAFYPVTIWNKVERLNRSASVATMAQRLESPGYGIIVDLAELCYLADSGRAVQAFVLIS